MNLIYRATNELYLILRKLTHTCGDHALATRTNRGFMEAKGP